MLRRLKFSFLFILLLLGTNQANAQCQAMFSNSTNGNTVTFTSTSTGNNLRYSWDFGDGYKTGFIQHATYYRSYKSSGFYTVCLTILDTISNCTDSICDTLTFNKTYPCEASFTVNNFFDHPYFTSTSKGNNLRYHWDFGDGNTSNGNKPNHLYSVPGTYTVCLFISDSASNCYDSTCQNIVITKRCISDFSHSTNELKVTFSNKSTGINLRNYLWDFGDGNSLNKKNPGSHTYSSPGTYNVCLIVADSAFNCMDTFCDSVVVSGPACKAKFNIYADSTTQYLIYVQDQSIGSNLSYNWNFGDGNTSTNATPTHTYSTFGTFILCLTVSDSGCSSSFCDTFTLDSSGNFSTKRGFTMVVLPNGPVSVQPPVEQLNINIYPNPFSNSLRLDWEKDAAGNIEIFDAAGRSQFKQSNVQPGSEIELSELGKGIYIMQLQIGDTVQQHRLIKQ